MSIDTEHAARGLTDEFFAGRLPVGRFDELFDHIRGCAMCRGYFDEVRAAHRALGGDAARPMARHEADLLWCQLRAAIAARPVSARARWWRPLALGLGAVGAAAVVALAVVPRADDGFSARGGTAAASALVRVLCLVKQGEDVQVTPLPDSAGAWRCPVGAFLMVAAAGTSLPPSLEVVALDPTGRHLYNARLDTPAPQQLFAGHLALEKPGPVRVVALGSPRPLADLEAALRAPPAGSTRTDLVVEVIP